jgi:6-phosphofructokinase 1
MKRIAVITSGGDSPGMNPAIRTVVRTAANLGIEVMGIRRGYAGLLGGEIDPLGPRDVGGIIQRGGTILRTARCPEFYTPQGQREGLRRLNEYDIDGLVVIGGNGSQSGAVALHKLDFPVIGVPSTIDNDLWGTDISIGVDTALNTILESIDRIKDTATSHGRAFLIETMGRNSGYLALMGGLAGGAEMIIIPERDTQLEDIAQTVSEAYLKGKSHALIVIAEGAKLKTAEIAQFLEQHETGFDVRVTILGHVQRGGSPSASDRILATRLGAAAVERLIAGERGILVGLQGREIASVPLEEAISRPKGIDDYICKIAQVLAK